MIGSAGGVIGGMAGAQAGSSLSGVSAQTLGVVLAVTIVMLITSTVGGYLYYAKEKKDKGSACTVIDWGGVGAMLFTAQGLLLIIALILDMALFS